MLFRSPPKGSDPIHHQSPPSRTSASAYSVLGRFLSCHYPFVLIRVLYHFRPLKSRVFCVFTPLQTIPKTTPETATEIISNPPRKLPRQTTYYNKQAGRWRGRNQVRLRPSNLPPHLYKCGGSAQAPFFIGGFIPAFARCCFCIAASLLVFTSPMILL